MQKQNKLNRAFSLIEISIVVLIIGLLVAGVIKGKELYVKTKLASARSLTSSSGINAIPNLKVWYETTSASSFNTASGQPVSEGQAIASWNDNKISLNSDKINVTQSNSTFQPIYVENGIGGLPSLRFDGADDRLFIANAPIKKGDDTYTMVAVWQATDSSVPIVGRAVISEDNKKSSEAAILFIRNSSTIAFGGRNNAFDVNIGSITNQNITQMIINNNQADNVSIYHNSNNATKGTNNIGLANKDLLNICGVNFYVGATHGGQYFKGLISEVMIFDRDLKASEVAKINSYLSQKYGIKIN